VLVLGHGPIWAPRVAHRPPLDSAPTPWAPLDLPTPQLSSRFDSRATHARKILPAALASVPFGFVLVRVRVFWVPHGHY
jgi:hypothetical protein